jgi:hypothetical protein
MNRRLAILAAALALPAAAVILWMVAPDPRIDAEAVPARDIPELENRTPSPESTLQSKRVVVSDPTTGSKMVRRADEDFPAPAPAPVAPAEPAPAISPRYTLATQPDAAALARRLEAQPPLERDERIRVLPASAATDASSTAEQNPANTGGAVLLRLDATLHDPAAWVDGQKPLGEKQEAIKAKIAAAKRPDTAGKTFDKTWRDARTKANWEYQKFFGGEAANRAAMNAARAALPKP